MSSLRQEIELELLWMLWLLSPECALCRLQVAMVDECMMNGEWV
jgi:hypothetical protein